MVKSRRVLHAARMRRRRRKIRRRKKERKERKKERKKEKEEKNAYRILVVKPERNRPLGRPRRRWVNTIQMDLRDGMDWYGLD
jgi:hypothetical protein